MNLADKSPEWSDESNYERTHKCRVWLYLHDFLTEAENRRVAQRIKRSLTDSEEASRGDAACE